MPHLWSLAEIVQHNDSLHEPEYGIVDLKEANAFQVHDQKALPIVGLETINMPLLRGLGGSA